MNNKVSIITPSYNSSRFIKETIQSIKNQNFKDWELLITDDCSTDDTWLIIKELAVSDPRIKTFQLKQNSGAGIARNNSISHAQGRYIAFCDSDDQWLPEKLEKQVAFMQKKKCALSFTSYYVIDERNNIKGHVTAKPFLDYQTMLKNNYIGCLTAMYDTEKLGKIYMPDIRKRQDWALWLSILKKVDKAYGIKEYLAKYRKSNNSISANKIDLIKYNWNIYHEAEGFSKTISNLLLIRFLFYHFRQKQFKV